MHKERKEGRKNLDITPQPGPLEIYPPCTDGLNPSIDGLDAVGDGFDSDIHIHLSHRMILGRYRYEIGGTTGFPALPYMNSTGSVLRQRRSSHVSARGVSITWNGQRFPTHARNAGGLIR